MVVLPHCGALWLVEPACLSGGSSSGGWQSPLPAAQPVVWSRGVVCLVKAAALNYSEKGNPPSLVCWGRREGCWGSQQCKQSCGEVETKGFKHMGWGRKKYREEQTSPSPQALLPSWVHAPSPLASKSSSKACHVGTLQAASCGTWSGGCWRRHS